MLVVHEVNTMLNSGSLANKNDPNYWGRSELDVHTRSIWLPLMDALRTLEFEITDEEVFHKLLQSAEA